MTRKVKKSIKESIDTTLRHSTQLKEMLRIMKHNQLASTIGLRCCNIRSFLGDPEQEKELHYSTTKAQMISTFMVVSLKSHSRVSQNWRLISIHVTVVDGTSRKVNMMHHVTLINLREGMGSREFSTWTNVSSSLDARYMMPCDRRETASTRLSYMTLPTTWSLWRFQNTSQTAYSWVENISQDGF